MKTQNIDKTEYAHPHEELEDAIYFLEHNTDFLVKSAPDAEIKLGYKHQLTKREGGIKRAYMGYLTDAQLIEFAKEHGFGIFQNIDLEKIIEDEALKCGKLECYGSTQVIHYVLDNHHVPHYVFEGTLEFNDKVLPTHLWIGLPDGRLVDFKARKWLGNDAPNGIFYPHDTTAKYEGKPIEMEVTDLVYKFLTHEV